MDTTILLPVTIPANTINTPKWPIYGSKKWLTWPPLKGDQPQPILKTGWESGSIVSVTTDKGLGESPDYSGGPT